ncbi:glucan 1,3-beta-glucosidase, partial [Tremellales sp. Uapishka_1]
MESPNLSSEKDAFVGTQYPSNRYLAAGGANLPPTQSTKYKEPRTCIPTNPTKRRWLFFGLPVGLVVVAGIVIGVVVAISHKPTTTGSKGKSSSGSTSSPTSTASYSPPEVTATAGSGSAGSTVTTNLGVQFTYANDFGGSWAQDPSQPYNVSGRAQSWTPCLLEDWTYGTDIVRGVNLGGWLVTEPFISPALYERYQSTTPQAIDEYTLSQAMGSNLSYAMEEHYATFITEKDFADIAAAGLNWVRIPLGYWAVETTGDEPYLAKVSWTYFLKAIDWSRKYGLRILLDFHALPGSQNGWNHSGKVGPVNWMYGVMGIANAQRHLEYIRSFTEFISQDGIKQVVPMFGLVNEVEADVVGMGVMESFYYQAYELVRGITGYGTGNGPILLLHEGFKGIAAWDGFLSGADRIALDQHPYLAFGTQNTNPWPVQITSVCEWGGGTNDTQSSFGLVMGGEWSNAINDCGLWLNGVGSTPGFESIASCTPYDEWFNWNDTMKAYVMEYSEATMDSLQNWFFWTWRIGNSTTLGYASSPFWHYQLGLEQGWIPKDPRVAGGYCSRNGGGGSVFNGTFPLSATGSVPTPTLSNQTELASVTVFPPTQLGPSPSFSADQISLFPTFTKTGSRITLASPTATGAGNGWFNSNDHTGAWVAVTGCSYPNAYNATASSLVPTAVCTGS